MSTAKLLASAFAIAAMAATSAMAGGWPNATAKKGAQSREDCCSAARNASMTKAETSRTARLVSPDGFEYLGGDTGWQLAQHKFEYRSGRLGHASDCPVSIAKAGGNLTPSVPGAPG